MLILHKLYSFTVPVSDLLEVYILYIRSVLESSAVVWHSSLTVGQELELERVQKVALKIILKERYESYDNALKLCALPSLKDRRIQLCTKFATKCVKSSKNNDMFLLKTAVRLTRQPEKFMVTRCNTERLRNSSIPYMQKLLNAKFR